MNVAQSLVYTLEVGRGRVLIRLIPLLVGFGFLFVFYDFSFYRGLNDAQSMDNAQLARRIARGEGFTTQFLRPYAVAQMQAYLAAPNTLSGGSSNLFPPDRFPAGTPRVLPDTYNAPGYPCVLAALFKALRPNFNETLEDFGKSHQYQGERWIPALNQVFLLLTLWMVFMLGSRLFDERVAWISTVALLLSDTIWQYSLTALSTCLLMFLVTAVFFCAVQIFTISERVSEEEEGSLAPTWFWSLLLGLLLAAACLTRLQLLILLAPLLLFFIVLPRAHPALFVFVSILVIGPVSLWFAHTYRVCGNPFGSNLPLLLYGGEDNYKDNQIYCATSIPSYDQLFKDVSKKEFAGFLWHFEQGWSLLGSSPMVLLAAAAILHRFKRQRIRAFQWLVVGSALSLVAVNNLCSAQPETIGAWNIVILVLPALLVIGSAFFFILLDRINPLPLVATLIVIGALALPLLPIINSLTTVPKYIYNFPPYVPPYISLMGRLAAPDEWVTTDMPWATAWYADRASLWLPDTMTDFENFHDNVCPTGLLLLTPVTLQQPLADLRSGEFKDWYSLAMENNIGSDFPLPKHVVFEPGRPGLSYSMWSNSERWSSGKK